MTEQIWFKEPQGFLTQDNFLRFFPTSDMNNVEQINAIVRFALYFTIIMLLFRNNYKIFYILVITVIISMAMYTVEQNKEIKKKETYQKRNLAKQKSTGKACRRPSNDNPFMNMLVSDYERGAEMLGKEACDVQNENVQGEMLENFNDKLYRSVGDVFNKTASDRQFYAVPNTDIIPDQGGFAEWLYGNVNKTCKSGNAQACWANASEVFIGTGGAGI